MSYLDQLFGLQGKSVAITGGAGLLCGEMASALAKAGCKVLILDRNPELTEKKVQEIRSAGGTAIAKVIDVTKKSEYEAALALCLKEFGSADVLINGAGINAPTPFMEIKEEEWDSIMAVQLKGVVFGCQVFGAHMLSKGKGSIINISSASAGPPLSKAFTYSVAKAGVYNLTQNLAREWGTKGVRVNALRPGFFPTEWSRKNFITAEREGQILGHTPMKRYGEANELVGAVLWLAGEASSFVTGSLVTIDGGFTAQTI